MKYFTILGLLCSLAVPVTAQYSDVRDGYTYGPTVRDAQLAFTCDSERGRSLFLFDTVPDIPGKEAHEGYDLYFASVKVGKFRRKVTLRRESGSNTLVHVEGSKLSNLRNLRLFKTLVLELPNGINYSFSLEGSTEPLRHLVEACKK